MAVRVVTDSAAGLPADMASDLDITVLDLHVMDQQTKDGVEQSTSGLTALELAAAFGRQAQLSTREIFGESREDGVLAIHLSRELSSTWSAAVAASGVFPDTVRVLDSTTAGMVQGAAAMAAATLAKQGATLDECYDAAFDIISRGRTWVYIHSTEDLRKSGRISAATVMISTALLAIRPIMAIHGGKLEMVGKTRTQTKAFTKMVELVQERAENQACFVAIQFSPDAQDAAEKLHALLEAALDADSSFLLVPLTDVLAVHAGPGAIGVSVVFGQEQVDHTPAKHPLFKSKKADS
ncbi:DegV domain-containing protein [Corynebacterium phocae]|uniref:DegV domain-containing protein n=1 Tax=Corynebacterium phocae TaxID=161895 RepID=A0A1L7D1R2_9CORY|nr:DegV family protein [Corynebacterium phocae]APT92085.1 DegV domain-containing protein [Corynebacterium phocae]KAA8726469.1 DegV family protein [Corynebacterium phocae]